VRASPPDLKTISKFAQLEYRLGEPERGKTLFEGIVDSHPKRWDLWSIYIDMEVGQNDIQSMRFGLLNHRFFFPTLTRPSSPQKPLRSYTRSKNDKSQSQVRFLHPVIKRLPILTWTLCTLVGLSSRNGLHWRKESGTRQVLGRSKQRLSNGLGAPQYTQQQQKMMSEV
jgi:hypothetical protein